MINIIFCIVLICNYVYKRKAHFPCGHLSSMSPLHSTHVWMRRYRRIMRARLIEGDWLG